MKFWLKNKRLVLTGKYIWADKDKCPCDCVPFTIVKWTSNGSNPQPEGTIKLFNLRPYQGNCIGTAGQKWRLVETGACLKYYRGDIDENGKLVGLPDEFLSSYTYNGYMELQVGCIQLDPLPPIWPGNCGN